MLRPPKADTMASSYVSAGIRSNMTYFCTSITLELIGTFFLIFRDSKPYSGLCNFPSICNVCLSDMMSIHSGLPFTVMALMGARMEQSTCWLYRLYNESPNLGYNKRFIFPLQCADRTGAYPSLGQSVHLALLLGSKAAGKWSWYRTFI